MLEAAHSAAVLRRLTAADEAQALAAHAELAAEGFEFLLDYDAGEGFAGYCTRLQGEERGEGLGPGRVAHTFLVAEAAGELVGRVSLRHDLTPVLEAIGGHVGYAVRPGFRGRGHARRLLQAALDEAARRGLDRVLATCDADNAASAAVIERSGGILENCIELMPGHSKRRYWIGTALARAGEPE